jgi:pyruvate dehydrogenase kinase 2/3/4
MALEPVARAVAEEIGRWASLKQTGVSLWYMMEFGSRPTERNLLLSAQFLHKELPTRIARRALKLEYLPFGLSNKPAVLKVCALRSVSLFSTILVDNGLRFLG